METASTRTTATRLEGAGAGDDESPCPRVPARVVLTIELRDGMVEARINTCPAPLSRADAATLARVLTGLMVE